MTALAQPGISESQSHLKPGTFRPSWARRTLAVYIFIILILDNYKSPLPWPTAHMALWLGSQATATWAIPIWTIPQASLPLCLMQSHHFMPFLYLQVPVATIHAHSCCLHLHDLASTATTISLTVSKFQLNIHSLMAISPCPGI